MYKGNVNDISAYFKSQYEWVSNFLSGLLEIPSVSGNERVAADYICRALDGAGVACEKIPISNNIRNHVEYSPTGYEADYNGQFNILLRSEGQRGKVIALNTHIDVVPPSYGQDDAFNPQLKDGVFYARGACDAKGQVAVTALLMKAARDLPQLRNELVCHLVVEEEFGGNGTLAMLEHFPNFHADLVVNLEPTELRLGSTMRGAIWYNMRFYGVSGHSGSTGPTQSALFKAIAAIDVLKQYHAELYERSKDYGMFKGMDRPMLLTVGKLNAGVWPSMVPNEAHLCGALGFLPNVTKHDVMNDIREVMNKPENKWISEGMELSFDLRHNGMELSVNHPGVLAMSDALEKNKLNGTPVAMAYTSDAVFYHEHGVPTVVFGPGQIADAHSSNEKISVDEILKAAETLYSFARDWS